MAASTKVLNTYELVEHLLLHLPLRQLLLAQRVNKYFNTVINDSLKINQALFLKPSTTERITWKLSGRNSWERQWTAVEGDNDGESQAQRRHGVLLNPFSKILLHSPNHGANQQKKFAGHDALGFTLTCDRRLDSGWLSFLPCMKSGSCNCDTEAPKPSVGGMLLSDPPIMKMEVWPSKPEEQGRRAPSGVRFCCARDITVASSPTGISYDKLRHELETKHRDAEFMEFYVEGGFYFWWIPDSVDDFTGWDCLKLLQMNGADREKLLETRYAQIREDARVKA